jgi:SSS family solute:Na+ symporter
VLRLHLNGLDYTLLFIYFAVVLAIGIAARTSIKSSLDFFLSGRSLPAWVTGLAFVSANLGAIEMPFYYGAKVRSVPEYLRLRFNRATHIFNALTFALAAVLIAGVNLYALALVLQNLLGWSLFLSICVAAGFVLVYITIGGLSGAIYNEVLQFFVILAGLIPVTVVGLVKVGGWHGLTEKVKQSSLGNAGLHAWQGTGIGSHNALGANWIGIVLGLGFVLSFGYWTTNFAEVQRALSAKSLSAAQRTPLIGAYPKLFIPALTIVPGLLALVLFKGLGAKSGDLQYNNAIPLLINDVLPNGVLGIAVTGLLAAFMAGMAANVSSFNTVMTYDLIQPYWIKDRDDQFYLRMGRIVTVVGIVVAVGTAGIASQYNNIMNYIQLLFGFFNAPLFATFIIAMFWKRATPWSGLYGLIAGTLGAAVTHVLYTGENVSLLGLHIHFAPQIHFASAQGANFWGAVVAFVSDAVVTVLVSLVTAPKPEKELAGLVWGTTRDEEPEKAQAGDELWWRSPKLLGYGALGITVVLNIIFI